MTSLLLVPLDDTVVFPTMDVTLPVHVGDEERVLLIPRHDGEFAKVGTIAEVSDHIRLPGGGRAVALSGVARGVAGAAHTDELGRLMIEVAEHFDDKPVDGRTRNLEREYRAIIEEILELRGADDRIAQFLRAIADPGPLADTIGYAPDVSFEDKVRALETLDVADRLAARRRAPARAPDRAAAAQEDPRGRPVRRGQAAARVHPAQADGVDPARAGRGRRLGRRGVPQEDRRGRHAGGGAGAGHEGARAPGAHGRAVRRVLDDPHLPRLADRRAVAEDLGREARSEGRPRGARRRPRRPRGRQGPHHGVPGGQEAAHRARASRRTSAPARSSR